MVSLTLPLDTFVPKPDTDTFLSRCSDICMSSQIVCLAIRTNIACRYCLEHDSRWDDTMHPGHSLWSQHRNSTVTYFARLWAGCAVNLPCRMSSG